METGINISFKIPIWLDRICAWPVMAYRKWKYGYDFRRIDLGEGEWTIVDQEDYYRLGNYKWHLNGSRDMFYAVRDIKSYGKIRQISMHREIMNAPKKLLVDHRDNNTLDNRRENLRLATHSQNMQNRRKTKSKTSSRFIGVCYDKRTGLWMAKIRYNGKYKWLGRFKTEIEAARAYDAAARKYHGEFARLNFPEENYINEVLV